MISIEEINTTGDKYKFGEIEVDEEKYYDRPAKKVQAALCMQTKRKFPDRKFKTAKVNTGIIVKRIK